MTEQLRPVDGRQDGQHEALDRVHVLTETLAAHVCDHPFVQGSPELTALAERAGDALGDLYQAIGRAA